MFIKIISPPDDAPNELSDLVGEVQYGYSIDDAILHAFMLGDDYEVELYQEAREDHGYVMLVPTNDGNPTEDVWWLCEDNYEVIEP
jgi:hypothetical protein